MHEDVVVDDQLGSRLAYAIAQRKELFLAVAMVKIEGGWMTVEPALQASSTLTLFLCDNRLQLLFVESDSGLLLLAIGWIPHLPHVFRVFL